MHNYCRLDVYYASVGVIHLIYKWVRELSVEVVWWIFLRDKIKVAEKFFVVLVSRWKCPKVET